MSDRDTRIEELNDKSRPDCRGELKETIYNASGKALRAMAKLVDPSEKSWPEDDEDCQTAAVKKTLRLQKPQLIDLLVKIEFPEDEEKPKTSRRRRTAKTEEAEETEEKTEEKTEKKPTRRRRRGAAAKEEKVEETKEDAPAAAFDMDVLVEAILEAVSPTLNGLAKAVEKIQKDLDAVKQGQLAVAIGAMGLDNKEAPETHDDLLEMFDLQG